MVYGDVPLAVEKWLIRKEEEDVEENNKLERDLRERLDRSVQVDSW